MASGVLTPAASQRHHVINPYYAGGSGRIYSVIKSYPFTWYDIAGVQLGGTRWQQCAHYARHHTHTLTE